MPRTSSRLKETVPEQPNAVERRSAERHRCCLKCTVRPEGAAGIGSWSAIIYNISVSGVGVVLPYPVSPGTTLVIQLWGRSTGRELRARVVRAVPVEFVFFHGCAFTQPLGEAELRGLLR
jgi:hypothetical protein